LCGVAFEKVGKEEGKEYTHTTVFLIADIFQLPLSQVPSSNSQRVFVYLLDLGVR
jgi:hypothetical protein